MCTWVTLDNFHSIFGGCSGLQNVLSNSGKADDPGQMFSGFSESLWFIFPEERQVSDGYFKNSKDLNGMLNYVEIADFWTDVGFTNFRAFSLEYPQAYVGLNCKAHLRLKFLCFLLFGFLSA